ncbi:sigma-70 family RNA polymerase sigma factor [Spiractinospora alimapuensis]|uniref:sigma-70 family RNA polymerase sigma factor n=1 Tax=Spiractinospora alimapuensis TaxID=2820884 RepID=UPI001F3E84B9|nr:sigma-70 family RNA polymerase sigma factor [Spiractinospora alimapuensis]QVQ50570.1 sigma-70 family RNA polymerase sigma factor [Spiractinospora alimapuensis]
MNEGSYGSAEAEVADNQLLDAVRAGDTSGYATLYERHCEAARSLAGQLARNRSEVDDIVSEAFARVLSILQRGAGPTDGFRAYLLASVRHVAYDRLRGQKRHVLTDDISPFDCGEPFVDPALEGLERSLIARAFLALPERYQAVLWHTEIEGARPSDVAPILGLSANGVAALAYRARERLREGYLQMHLANNAPEEKCRPALERLGAYVRGGLAKRESATVDGHLDSCGDCRHVYAELMDVNVGLRGIVGPLIAGVGFTGYLSALPTAGTAVGVWGRMPKRQQQGVAAGAAAALVIAAVALAPIGDHQPIDDESEVPAQAAPDQPGGGGGGGGSGSGGGDGDGDGGGDGGDSDGADSDTDGPDSAAAADNDDPDDPSVDPAVAGFSIPAPPPPLFPVIIPPEAVDPPESEDDPEYGASIAPAGALVPGRPGVVVISLVNNGGEGTEELTADLTFPDGVSLAPGAAAGSSAPATPRSQTDGWTCVPEPEGAQCTRAGLEAGASTTDYVDVDVASSASGEGTLSLSVRTADGEVLAEAEADRGVTTDGVPARYAGTGSLRVEAVGNALLRCTDDSEPDFPFGVPNPVPGQLPIVPEPLAPNPEPGVSTEPAWNIPDPFNPEVPDVPESPDVPDLPDPTPPPGVDGPDLPPTPDVPAPDPEEDLPEVPSEPEPEDDADEGSCAQALERGGDNRNNDAWSMRPADDDDDPTTSMSSAAELSVPEGAEVRWAGLYFSGVADPASGATARLRGPQADGYTEVPAQEVDSVELPNYSAYQGFADVTEQVRDQGGGTWWVADIPGEAGVGHYAGWSLVTVIDDPDAPNQTAMVLDTAQAIQHDSDGIAFPLAGLLPADAAARFDVVAWEGDADIPGDQVLLDEQPLTPLGGDQDPNNAFASYSQGAVGPPLTFGTDVVGFEGTLEAESAVRLVTEQDALAAGVVAVTAEAP